MRILRFVICRCLSLYVCRALLVGMHLRGPDQARFYLLTSASSAGCDEQIKAYTFAQASGLTLPRFPPISSNLQHPAGNLFTLPWQPIVTACTRMHSVHALLRRSYLANTLGEGPYPQWGVPQGWGTYLAGALLSPLTPY